MAMTAAREDAGPQELSCFSEKLPMQRERVAGERQAFSLKVVAKVVATTSPTPPCAGTQFFTHCSHHLKPTTDFFSTAICSRKER